MAGCQWRRRAAGTVVRRPGALSAAAVAVTAAADGHGSGGCHEDAAREPAWHLRPRLRVNWAVSRCPAFRAA